MNNENISPKPNSFSPFAVLCLLFGFLMIALTALQWDLSEMFTPFFLGPLMLCLGALFVLFTLAAVVYLVVQFKKNPARAVLPLVINSVMFLVLWFVPFTKIRMDIEFRINSRAYTEIIAMVEDGRIQPDEYGLALLPSGYYRISRGGEILVDNSDGVTSVFFYTFRGVLDNFSGYLYRSNGTPPLDFFMGGDWMQIIQKQPQWYFCASR